MLMDGQQSGESKESKRDSLALERFLTTTFDKLPAQTKVLVALFAALNSTATLTEKLDLSDRIWQHVRFNGSGPLVGESEEVNWLKGVCDGILLIADYS
jgi:hypothetical protein